MSIQTQTMARLRAGLLALTLAALALAVGVTSVDAKSTIFSYTGGPSTTQAGAHPDVVTTMLLGNRFNQGQQMSECACDDPKDITVHSPPGLIANPHVVSICTAAQARVYGCPADSQAGFVIVKAVNSVFPLKWSMIPIYRTIPKAGQAALFQFAPPEIGLPNSQYVSVNARTGTDYGLDVKTEGIEHIIPPEYIAQVFWGVPGLPAHDPIRFEPGEVQLHCGTNPLEKLLEDVFPEDCGVTHEAGGVEGLELSFEKPPVASSLPVKPFLQNPTICSGPLSSSIETLAYDGEVFHHEEPWPETTGCDQLSFDPSLSASPTTTQTDTAAGMDVTLKVAQYQDPNVPSPSEIRATTVTLPKGFSINPNAADGKTFCSDEEASFGSIAASDCPEFAKIGTDVLDTPALPGPIPGEIYIGEPRPGDRYRVFITAGGFGTFVKIAGSVRPDPQTGQLVISFENLPQAPFQRFDLHFFGSERGLLSTPTKCGTYPVHTTFVPWDAEISNQESTQFFVLDSGPGGSPCPGASRPFSPAFEAGTQDSTAGVHSPFAVKLTRNDGDQNLTGLTVTAPPGFVATLKGIPYCPQSALDQLSSPDYLGLLEISVPACPIASQIGTAVAGAGSGTRPLHVSGKVYLAGPYKGAPLSLVAVIPAVSGPYDLGNVAVRAAIQVNPETAQVTTVSDPLPQILGGIPLRTRLVQVDLDRPNFAQNPTNCESFEIGARASGDEGATAVLESHFQASNCADLEYEPKLKLRMSGGVNRRGHPKIRAVLTTAPGEANTKRTTVTLPKGQLLDNAHIRNICTRVEFAAESCPPSSMIGSAEVTTPILDQPLRGSVYLRSSSNPLPDIVVDLRGQIDVVLVGRIMTPKEGRLRTAFQTVPDAPVTRFELNLLGGRKGLVQNSESLCGGGRRATVAMTGQNGKVHRTEPKLSVSCGSGSKRRHRQTGRAVH